ncbi:hypothetical protein BPJM79_100043 [Bacillus pumilus]
MGACSDNVVFEGRLQCDDEYNIEVDEHFFTNFDIGQTKNHKAFT